MAAIGPIKTNVRIGRHRSIDDDKRPIVAASLGCHVPGLTLCHPDPGSALTYEAGMRKRFATQTPVPDKKLIRDFTEWLKIEIRKDFEPLPSDSDTSLETWLAGTTYSDARKQELRLKFAAVDNIWDRNQKYFRVKSFMKDEWYPAYKHARPINSRSDEFKCVVGPIFKLIESAVYSHPAFIKHTPVSERPAEIAETFLPGDRKSVV